ncbi:MAG: hypothetical protein ACFBSC_14465 [Microcoleaceae cyanobacterium]
MLKFAIALLAVTTAILGFQSSGVQADRSVVVDALAQNRSTPYFPNVSGRNINNRSYNLPGDFEGEYNVVLLAFAQEQQFSVNTWMEALRAVESQYSGVRVYELPTLPEMSWFERKQLDFWMATGISDPLSRATTITLYTDMNNIQNALKIGNTSKVRLFLVDRAGKVYWRGQGVYSEAQFQELSNVIVALQ